MKQPMNHSNEAELLAELHYAHQIIRNALNIMQPWQQSAWAEKNAKDGVDGEGTTRANERLAVIERMAQHASSAPQSRYLAPCPFCGEVLKAQWDRPNPKARCHTAGCKAGQLPVLNLDQPNDVAAWNRRLSRSEPEAAQAQRDAEILGFLSALVYELELVATDPDSHLSPGAQRTIRWALIRVGDIAATQEGAVEKRLQERAIDAARRIK